MNQKFSVLSWASALGPILEQAGLHPEFDVACLKIFAQWKNLVLFKLKKAPFEQYFIGLKAIGEKSMLSDAALTIEPFLKWGYLGNEFLINKAKPNKIRTFLRAESKRAVLKELITTRSRLTVKDYRQALLNLVSERQAELDLKNEQHLTPHGRTKGRGYLVKKRHRKRTSGL